jgi:HSP20 family protein
MSQRKAKQQPGSETLASQSTERPTIVGAERLLDRMKEVSEAIAKQAYEFFEKRGREFGRDIDDWLHAELELLRPVPFEIVELEGELKVRAEVPGFTAKDIQVSVEPHRVIISGKLERTTDRQSEGTESAEVRSDEIFRTLELPTEIDPSKATAILKDGVLNLTLAKAAISEPVKVEVTEG